MQAELIFKDNKTYLKFPELIKIFNSKIIYFTHYNDWEYDNQTDENSKNFFSYFVLTEEYNNQKTSLTQIDDYTFEFNKEINHGDLLKTFKYIIKDNELILFEIFPGGCNICLDGSKNLTKELYDKLIYNGENNYKKEKKIIFDNFHLDLDNTYLKNCKDPILYFFNSCMHKYGYLKDIILNDNEKKLLNNKLVVYINEPIIPAKNPNYEAVPILENLQLFAKNNNINIIICGCNWNINININYSNLKIYCKDIHLLKSSLLLISKISNINNNITKKFWSGNWTYRYHRRLIMNFICQKSGNYSWPRNEPLFTENDFKNLRWIDKDILADILINNKYLYENSPLYMDLIPLNKEVAGEIYPEIYARYDNDPEFVIFYSQLDTNDCAISYFSSVDSCTSKTIKEFYKECFCSIVTETGFDNDSANVSEKTFGAITYRRPFILVAGYKSLEYLKQMGFKTFSDYWDESYDLEKDAGKRFIKICRLINYIDSFNIKELKDIYNNMQNILDYNIEILKQFPFDSKFY